MNARKSKSADFFDTHPVFRSGEFVAVHTQQGQSDQTSHNLLAHHLATGSILRVRRGLYATVPRGAKPADAAIDPFLVASHLTDDAVVAYHAALRFAGKNYSVWRRYHVLTRLRARPFRFRDIEFVPVQIPARLRRRKGAGTGVVEERHAGGRVRVTTLERTLVDVLDAPEKAGGWEEIWRALEMVSFFDLDAVIAHTRARGSPLPPRPRAGRMPRRRARAPGASVREHLAKLEHRMELDAVRGAHRDPPPLEAPPAVAALPANRASIAREVPVMESPPSAVHRSSRGSWPPTRCAVSTTSSK